LLIADLGNKKISSEHWGTIKTLISGEPVERKGRDPFDMTPFAKLIFSCNEIPELPDNTFATWRRLILLEFENLFTDENKDVNLISKLTTDEEVSGLLNEALIALKQLIENNEFAYTKDIETIRKIYETNSNTMAKFKEQRLLVVRDELDNQRPLPDPSDRLYEICRDVSDDYMDFCKNEGRNPKTDAQLGTYLKMALAGKWGGRHKKRINYEEEYVYDGIRLRPKPKDPLK
jgi:phage/plasmid-associated DNA primase